MKHSKTISKLLIIKLNVPREAYKVSALAVSELSHFVSNPGDDHCALERVMRYLKGDLHDSLCWVPNGIGGLY